MLQPINFQRWIDDNHALLQPPVCNKVMWLGENMFAMVVGGPTKRSDYHVNPTEEYFYQIQGDMVLKVIAEGKMCDVPIKQGETLLLPANMPHSPQRSEHSIGLVIELVRAADQLDAFQWYCDNCETLLYQDKLHVANIETQLPIVFDKFYSSEDNTRCKQCNTVKIR